MSLEAVDRAAQTIRQAAAVVGTNAFRDEFNGEAPASAAQHRSAIAPERPEKPSFPEGC